LKKKTETLIGKSW